MIKYSLPYIPLMLAMALAGSAISGAATLLNEGFEGGANAFGMPTYGYAEGYTLTNTLTPSAGLRYAHGGNPAGADAVGFSKTFSGPTLVLTNFGFTNEQIDAGLVSYNLTSQFSTYQGQNDYAVVSIVFRDVTSQQIGGVVQIGGSSLVSGLAGGTGSRDWASAFQDGFVPVGTREVVVTLAETKTPQGAYIDGYVDNVRLDLNVVPEPGSLMLSLAGTALFLRRRR